MNLEHLFFRITHYISYRLRAKGLHGTHSPFVYELIKKCIKPVQKGRIEEIERQRRILLANHQLIEVADFKSANIQLRRISSIAKASLSTRKFSVFLHYLADYVQAQSGLETGTSLGINVLYLAKTQLNTITTIEGSQIIAAIAKKTIGSWSRKVRLVNHDIYQILEEEIVRSKPDFYFLDADHRSSAVAFCIDLILKHTPEAKCIVIHDIYWSEDMRDIWHELIQDPRFKLSIDLFQGGLLFPNLEMPKQHFVLRF